MNPTPDKKPEAGGLESLAGEAQQTLQASAPAEPGAVATAQQDAEAQQQAALELGVQKVLLGLLKVARAAIAKRLPEIREEWTDDVLEAPAAAAVPLARKYMGKLMEIAGNNPELAGFVVACVPLGMGLYTAYERAEARRAQEKPTTEGGAPPAAPPDGNLG